jgi:imidazolonepropionase
MRFLLRDIGELVTLAPAAAKQGRHIGVADLGVLKRASLLIENGRIAWIGSKLPKEWAREGLREISAAGRTVMPAFTECHTHLIFAGHRQHEFERRNLGASYQEIARAGGGILHTVSETRAASLATLKLEGQRRAARFVRQGVTTLECKSGYGLDFTSERKILKAAAALVGPRVVTTYLAAHALPPEFSSYRAYLDHLMSVDLQRMAREKLAARVDIFIEDGYFSIADGRPYLQKARELGLQIVIHAEQMTRTGATRLAVELGALSADHLVQVNDEDIRALASSQTTAVLLPTSDLYLRMKYPPARAMLDQGVRVALATDFNPGTSPTQDLSLVGVLARLEMKMSLPEVLSAYTLGAAYALGLQNEIGSIEVGKSCDLVELDGEWSELFYQVGYHPISRVWKMGRTLRMSESFS